jgi:hypothetical protein
MTVLVNVFARFIVSRVNVRIRGRAA